MEGQQRRELSSSARRDETFVRRDETFAKRDETFDSDLEKNEEDALDHRHPAQGDLNPSYLRASFSDTVGSLWRREDFAAVLRRLRK